MTDADQALASLDPSFDPEETSLYKEHKPPEVDVVKAQLAEAEKKMDVLNQQSRKAQYESDTLALARDLAQIFSLMKQVEKSERTRRLEAVSHLRSQNTIGASIVNEYMSNNLSILCGVIKEQMNHIDRVWSAESLPTKSPKLMLYMVRLI